MPARSLVAEFAALRPERRGEAALLECPPGPSPSPPRRGPARMPARTSVAASAALRPERRGGADLLECPPGRWSPSSPRCAVTVEEGRPYSSIRRAAALTVEEGRPWSNFDRSMVARFVHSKGTKQKAMAQAAAGRARMGQG